ncbi:hypothetical protein ACH4ND_30255 [Streptomyces sp. NPDC017179]|uniref:hypothetical protein n=1 Tax=Streptomyces sp. NPDC017179 TaxID=3364979 RepID=UPI0037BB8299
MRRRAPVIRVSTRDRRDPLPGTIEDPARLLGETIRAGLPTGPDDALMRLLYEFDVPAERSTLRTKLAESMYERQLATYRTVLELGAAAGAFNLVPDTATAALNLVALEDAYGLHIVARNGQISVRRAVEAMLDAARAFGAPAARPCGHGMPLTEQWPEWSVRPCQAVISLIAVVPGGRVTGTNSATWTWTGRAPSRCSRPQPGAHDGRARGRAEAAGNS